MKEKIEQKLIGVLESIGIKNANFSIEHPADFSMGDYSTNVAMVYAKELKTNPKELAEKIVSILKEGQKLNTDVCYMSDIKVAGPGFINFYLSREFFTNSIEEILKQKEGWGKNNISSGKKIMVEYTDPNPFKPFHIGHLMTNAIGESISRIVEFSGAKTVRANYQGDIGPHVAKAIWGLMKFGLPDGGLSTGAQAQYIGECYSKGSNEYDTDENVKKEVEIINKKVYNKSDDEINKIYDLGRKITLDAFEEIYKILGTKFSYYFFESEMAPIGESVVRENIGKVFTESDGAIVFHGEEYDKKLHTRVFINSHSLPTYETKEIGLTMTKFEKEDPDLSIVVTATEQAEYMKVVQKAISILHPDLESRMKHITHGMMKFASGKMSSRKGNVVTGESLLRDSMDMVLEKVENRDLTDIEKKDISKIVGVAALKYSILKPSLGSDIIYDFEKSISFEGDSGPYLQYTAVRANAILNKAKNFNFDNKNEMPTEVKQIEKLLYQFPEVVERAYLLLEPHHITTYLTELASSFNSFYANTLILQDDNTFATYHIEIIKSFYQTMKNGLWLLGIETPERM